jgi:hypothetical protein
LILSITDATNPLAVNAPSAWMSVPSCRIERLPAAVRPSSLSDRYPGIANLIAMDGNNDARCPALLDELLVGRREYREVFPADAHRGLRALRDHHDPGTPTLLE